MTTLKMPSVFALARKLEPSDGVMLSGNWQDINTDELWVPIQKVERRNRAVKSNFKKEVLNNEEALQKQITEPNLSWGDDAAIQHGQDTLRLDFSLRVVSGIEKPDVCNSAEFESRFREKINEHVQHNVIELAQRYAYNIVNGRFLWRNRIGAQQINIVVSCSELNETLIFDAYQFPLSKTCSFDPHLEILANIIAAGLKGEKNIVLKISAFAQLGNAQRVWPSQEMILNSPKGEKSRHLFFLNNVNGKDNVAAVHCEKIGNALRTIDDWYPQYSDTQQPIAIEAYGTVSQKGLAYRSSKNDFVTHLLNWINEDSSKVKLTDDDKHFVVAMLIRGGVFGESDKE